MAEKKFFGKMLDLIGLEETTLEEEEGFDPDYDDMDDEDYDIFDPEPTGRGGYDDMDDDIIEEEPENIFSRGAARRNRGRNANTDREGKVVGLAPNNKMKMIVYQPMSYDDTQNIIDNLKNRKPIIVNLETLELDIAQRILDFMSGAVYALNGNIHKVSKGIFVLVPNNVDISGNIPDELQGKSFYTLGVKQRREN